MCKVLSIFPIEGNSAVSIEGNGDGFRNDIYVTNEHGTSFHVISVAMVRLKDHSKFGECTELLIEGKFEGEMIAPIS